MQHDYILLDRSGSMAGIWSDALGSINGYVASLARQSIDTGVTLIAFDSDPRGDIRLITVRDRIIPATWRPVTADELAPDGGTPLNDAIAHVARLALRSDYVKVSMIVMTDGEENMSRVHPGFSGRREVNKLLDVLRAKDWPIVFLGANFDNKEQAEGFGARGGQHVNSTVGNLRWTMDTYAARRGLYSSGAVGQSMNTMSFTEDEASYSVGTNSVMPPAPTADATPTAAPIPATSIPDTPTP